MAMTLAQLHREIGPGYRMMRVIRGFINGKRTELRSYRPNLDGRIPLFVQLQDDEATYISEGDFYRLATITVLSETPREIAPDGRTFLDSLVFVSHCGTRLYLVQVKAFDYVLVGADTLNRWSDNLTFTVPTCSWTQELADELKTRTGLDIKAYKRGTCELNSFSL